MGDFPQRRDSIRRSPAQSLAERQSPPQNAAAIAAAKAAAGIAEDCKTWADWKAAGFEVVHGNKALFRAVLIWASHGDGKMYTASFFGASQVQPIEA